MATIEKNPTHTTGEYVPPTAAQVKSLETKAMSPIKGVDKDDALDQAELERVLEHLLGRDVTKEQAARLIKLYGGFKGDASKVSRKQILKQLSEDRVLVGIPGSGSISWAMNWANIPLARIAAALVRVNDPKADPATATLTASQLVAAYKKLLGKTLSLADAKALVTRFGTNGRVSVSQIARILDAEASGDTRADRAASRSDAALQPLKNDTEVFRYLMSGDTDKDGTLSEAEFKAIVDARANLGNSLTGYRLSQIMRYYGLNKNGARVLNQKMIMAMIKEGVIVRVDKSGFNNIDINVGATPIKRVVIGASVDNNSLDASELQLLFSDLGANVPIETCVALIKHYGKNGVVTVADVMQDMVRAGVLKLPKIQGGGVTLNYDKIGTPVPVTPKPVTPKPKPKPVSKPHHHQSWWKSAIKGAKHHVKTIVQNFSKLVGVAEEIIADLLDGRTTLAQAIKKAGKDFFKTLWNALKTGSKIAVKILSLIGNALLNTVKGLGEATVSFIKNIVKLATSKKSRELAVKSLLAIASKGIDGIKKGITKGVALVQLLTKIPNMTFDQLIAYFPGFKQKYTEGLKWEASFAKDAAKVFADFSRDDAGKKLLSEEGLKFSPEIGDLLDLKTGKAATEKRKLNFRDKHMRFDFALEFNKSLGTELGMSDLQARVFVTAPRRDASGKQYLEVRFRVLGAAGVQVGETGLAADAGLVNVHDLVFTYYKSESTGKYSKPDGTRYQSSLALAAELSITPGVRTAWKNTIDKVAKWLAPFLPSSPKESLDIGPKWWQILKKRTDVEMGFGGGLTVAYDIRKIGAEYLPFIGLGELVGGFLGVGVVSAFASEEEVATAGSPVARQFSEAITMGGGMVGSFIADVILAGIMNSAFKTRDGSKPISLNFGLFAWGAFKAGPEVVGGKLRGRFQVNIGQDFRRFM